MAENATERYAGAPIRMDPRQIIPDARALIAMGFRGNALEQTLTRADIPQYA